MAISSNTEVLSTFNITSTLTISCVIKAPVKALGWLFARTFPDLVLPVLPALLLYDIDKLLHELSVRLQALVLSRRVFVPIYPSFLPFVVAPGRGG